MNKFGGMLPVMCEEMAASSAESQWKSLIGQLK